MVKSKLVAVKERIFLDSKKKLIFFDLDGCQGFTFSKCFFPNSLEGLREDNRSQKCTAIECLLPDGREGRR